MSTARFAQLISSKAALARDVRFSQNAQERMVRVFRAGTLFGLRPSNLPYRVEMPVK
jgi:hypothetical protein